jgi:tellurite resistance protein TerC
MLADTGITAWHWGGFVVAVLIFLALDLGVFHRSARVVNFREALLWTAIWCATAIAFALLIAPSMVADWDKEEIVEFVTGYIIEISLSMDNVFVIALIFTYFGVPRENQHRVLFWGIIGALVMRGSMILLGSALIARFQWMLDVLGAFLLFTGVKMVFSEDAEVNPEKNFFIRTTRRFFPVSNTFDGARFVTRINQRRVLTPLALVLVMVETTDLIFAVDSIPAIFAVTQKPFIVFTSNVFAILGLRSLYFVLAGAIDYFRYLKIGLSVVLCIIGGKMLIAHWYVIPTSKSLIAVGIVLLVSIVASIIAGKRRGNDSGSDAK